MGLERILQRRISNLRMSKELRVYVVDTNLLEVSYEELTDGEFVQEAENQGNVYSLVGFQEAFNDGEIDASVEVLRVIEIE